MKSWTRSDDATLLGAPTKKREDTGIRVRALVATFATTALFYGFVFGVDALFPDVKNWSLPHWMTGRTATSFDFEWSEVCVERFEGCCTMYVDILSHLGLAELRSLEMEETSSRSIVISIMAGRRDVVVTPNLIQKFRYKRLRG